jgi:predicted transcriptional regulator
MSKRTPVMVRCGHCRGAGKVEAPELSEALALLGGDWISSATLAQRMNIVQTNACNKLAQLFELGLVERRTPVRREARRQRFEWRVARIGGGR